MSSCANIWAHIFKIVNNLLHTENDLKTHNIETILVTMKILYHPIESGYM